MTESLSHLTDRIRQAVERLSARGDLVTIALLAAALGMSTRAMRRHAAQLVADRVLQRGPAAGSRITLMLGETGPSVGTPPDGVARGAAGAADGEPPRVSRRPVGLSQTATAAG